MQIKTGFFAVTYEMKNENCKKITLITLRYFFTFSLEKNT